MEKMRFACITDVKKVEVRERPLPEMKDDEVLVKQLGCNICTADYGQWLGKRNHQGFPMAGGHEGSGVIVKMGSKVHGFHIGDLVSTCLYGCGKCEMCYQGLQSQCTSRNDYADMTEDGYHLGIFGFADYFVRKASTIIKMNPNLDPSEADFLEPLATVVFGLRKLRVKPLEDVVVIGGGTMGMVNALTLRAYGCNVIISELMDKKINIAREMGFNVIDSKVEDPVEAVMKWSDQRGADAVVMAVGSTPANAQAIKMLKHMDGRILYFAANYPSPELEVNSNTVHYRRIELLGTIGADRCDFDVAAKLLNTGAVNVSKLVEPIRYKLDDAQEAFEAAATPGAYRICIRTAE